MIQYYSLKTHDDCILDVAVFPVTGPIGLVQIIHGALEYKERYLDFATFLQNQGYVVVLSDNRGHGASLGEKMPVGLMESYQELIADQVAITHFIKEMYPDVPLTLFGHSFGSLLARVYLQDHDEELANLILTGTVNYLPAVAIGMRLSKLFIKRYGPLGHSKLVAKMTGDLEGGTDWLTTDQAFNQQVAADPKMLKRYPVRSSITIWETNYQLKQFTNYQVKNPKLRILSIAGALDKKITGGSKGLNDTVATLKKIGYAQVESIMVANMRHEVLNEPQHQQVYDLIVKFLAES